VPRKAKAIVCLVVLAIIAYLGISTSIIVAHDSRETTYKYYFSNAFGTFPPDSSDEVLAMQPRVDDGLKAIEAKAKNTDPEFPSEYYAKLLPEAKKAAAHYGFKINKPN
jgi:hypothetical protein